MGELCRLYCCQVNLADARSDLADATTESLVRRKIQRAFRKVVISLNPTPDERVMAKTNLCARVDLADARSDLAAATSNLADARSQPCGHNNRGLH